jgi:hemoglobin-like flavoprotein
MTEKQIQLVRESWQLVAINADAAGELFYSRLFEVAPSMREMFSGDMRSQSRKLMGMLGMIVSKLDKLDSLIDDIKMLAKRHDTYGARPAHYQVVGETLIWTLSTGLSEKWNEETEQAWIAAYTILANAMIHNQTFQQEPSLKVA